MTNTASVIATKGVQKKYYAPQLKSSSCCITFGGNAQNGIPVDFTVFLSQLVKELKKNKKVSYRKIRNYFIPVSQKERLLLQIQYSGLESIARHGKDVACNGKDVLS